MRSFPLTRSFPCRILLAGTVAMVGTLFLFCYWSSFNASFLSGAAAARAAMNTILSISASCATVFSFSRFLRGGKRLDMEHIANSTVSGGVVVRLGHLLWGYRAAASHIDLYPHLPLSKESPAPSLDCRRWAPHAT